MSGDDEYDDPYDYGECGNCGGEGYVYHCIDGCCADAEEGCELCARRCDWCNPPKRKPSDSDGLRQVLADALAATPKRGRAA